MYERASQIEFKHYQRERVSHWDQVASELDNQKSMGGYYHQRLTDVFRFLVPESSRVLEIGCGQGDLLAALKPSTGVGVDFSDKMIERAKTRHPGLRFLQADAHNLEIDEKFDFIILSDLVNDLWDVQAALNEVNKLCEPNTRIIINSYSRVWEIPLLITKWLELAKPTLNQNWLTVDDISDLLNLAGFEVIRDFEEILLPLPIPGIASFFNRFLVKLWPFKFASLTNFIVARPIKLPCEKQRKPTVSVLVPARNEAGNILSIFERVPEMGGGTELLFVEGHSKDNTYEEIEKQIEKHPGRNAKLIRQTGKGKGNAVREGFAIATGDILMILDADLTVPPEDLPRFYESLVSGKGEFINGVRLVYPMQDEAMRFLNIIGNKFFSLAFTWLLGQPIKDTLCGTKVLWKKNYKIIDSNRSYFGDFDPFGDFDLLFGAAKANMKIIGLPIRYRSRTYGSTNINRWSHGWLLLKMVFFAIKRIKFK